MKKLTFIISFMLVIVVALTSCSKQNSTQDTNNSLSESPTMLEEGEWPENEYTEGLSVPPGTVSWAVLDTTKGYCAINLIDLTDDEYNAITKTQYVYRFKYLKFLNDWLQGGK